MGEELGDCHMLVEDVWVLGTFERRRGCHRMVEDSRSEALGGEGRA